ncbi:MAG: ABC transporter permease, partial [bacterium]|nr:ABC transporter permease [bacterium]
PGVVNLISREFLALVLFANIAAWPLSWYLMDKWLQQFAYRTEIDLSVFIISGLAALIIAIIAVSYQSIRAALINPVESIKYE